MSETATPMIAVVPSNDDYTRPDSVGECSYFVVDFSPDGIGVIGIVGYVDHLGVWGYQTCDHSTPVLAMDGDLESTMNDAISQLIAATPF